MLHIDGTTITLTCGDSALIGVSAKDKDGELYEFEVGDTIKFTVKATAKKTDDNVLVEKSVSVDESTDVVNVMLEPNDTKSLDFKKYYYDIQLIKVNGWVDTIIEDSIFKVGVEIG